MAVLIITAVKEEVRPSVIKSKRVGTDALVKQTHDFFQGVCSLCTL